MQAVGVDGNNCTYPVAYAVVEGETKETWKWLFELLSEDLNIYSQPHFTFMSDQQKGLLPALAEVMPHVEHRYCIRHLYNNFRKLHRGLHLKEIMFNAAKAPYIPRFEFHMKEMAETDEATFKWLCETNARFWSRSHFKTSSNCDILDNNMCECFNSNILEPRGKTILPMLEDIRL